MDAARYARIRELFLEAEELDPDRQREFLESKVDDDPELIAEVTSLLAEHNAESARLEGERAAPVQPPLLSRPPAMPSAIAPGEKTAIGSTAIGPSAQAATGKKPKQGLAVGAPALGDSDITLQGAQRTHAAPRYDDDTRGINNTQPRNSFWDQRMRRNRRLNSGWLWLAAVLPTALIGWWTYSQVAASQREAISRVVFGLANSVALSADGFLNDRAALVESWSRQAELRTDVIALVEIAKQDDNLELLKSAPHSSMIHAQLRELSGHEDVKFVVWDRTGTTVASWLPDQADIGTLIAPSGAGDLGRVMRGETVLFGPARLKNHGNGFIPETQAPVMASIVPIRNDKNEVVAAMLVRGINMFDDFDALLREASQTSGLDVYAINLSGTMVSNSPRATMAAKVLNLELPPEKIAGNLRVSDPGFAVRPKNIGTILRTAQPLTYAAAGATAGKSDVRVGDYNNYAGVPVVGAWR